MPICADVQRDVGLRCNFIERLPNTQITRLNTYDACRRVSGEHRKPTRLERHIIVFAQSAIFHHHTLCHEFGREMAHGRKKQGGASLV
jgi:hypothetical protein